MELAINIFFNELTRINGELIFFSNPLPRYRTIVSCGLQKEQLKKHYLCMHEQKL